MVSGFPDISKIVILFNCGIDSAELHELLCSICNKLPQHALPGLFTAVAVVVGGPLAIGKLWWGTTSPTRKNGGGVAGEV